MEADLKHLCQMPEEQVPRHALPMVLSAPLPHSVERDKHRAHAQGRCVMRMTDTCMNESLCVCPHLGLSACTRDLLASYQRMNAFSYLGVISPLSTPVTHCIDNYSQYLQHMPGFQHRTTAM